jgi:hypothetical protein
VISCACACACACVGGGGVDLHKNIRQYSFQVIQFFLAG